ncbi:hypothetical protein [Lacinutrix sp. MedPE-SW]|uniref:hypothetical protein n=1 Tax=Lacinutrix sp. MedPE-SW TaxID=1860087 RepID=UPI00091884E3|nr:hypothetical protein [Lacinutrix sp. MedPE-SW]OIQ22273.1 MAG: hypothetical protein BM549_07195 [Lacinutrix sp. MedPE-SW]
MKLLTTICFIVLSLSLSAKNSNLILQNMPEVGDHYIVNENTGETYKHINFPRPNILVKRGAVASYNSVKDAIVTVTNVAKNKNGETIITVERKDGTKFFGFLKSAEINYEKALEAKEIAKLKA